jgi:hypothetical protein
MVMGPPGCGGAVFAQPMANMPSTITVAIKIATTLYHFFIDFLILLLYFTGHCSLQVFPH